MMNEGNSVNRLLPAAVLPNGDIQCRLVIFDFDGTVIDTGPGIKNAMGKAFAKLGLPAHTEEELDAYIGPPIRSTFRDTFRLPEDEAAEAVRTYRRFYNQVGVYDGVVYDGIPALLASLKDKGYELAVGTSKPWVVAQHILRHFGLRQYFNSVFGSFIDGRQSEKAQVLQSVVDHYTWAARLPRGRLAWGEAGAAERGASGTMQALMIGDRYYDVEGAKAIGLPTIGVAYGYGTAAELDQAGAVLVVRHPREIDDRLPRL